MEKKTNNKQQNLATLGLVVVAIILLNVVSQFVFHRFDLTAEKRYTLAESTKEMLDSLDDVVYFEVYLEGNFPKGAGDYQHLRDETRIMLDEFRAWSNDNIQYEFVDPGENSDEKARKAFQRQLIEKGLIPHAESNIGDDGAQVNQLLFPWAICRYHGREIPVPLLGSSSQPSEEAVNHAIEGLEYELSNGIRKVLMNVKPKIAITQGHGEPDSLYVSDFVQGLKEYYDVTFVPFGPLLNTFRDTVQNATQIRNKYDALVMIDPDSAFTTQELFILDQFIVYGGKAMFLVDATTANMDSIQIQGTTVALPKHYGISQTEPGLEDVLYSYGAGLKSELVEDVYCSQVMIPMGQGQQTQFVPRPWVYSPTILPLEKHPIVKNLDRIKFDFVGSIDTITTSAPIKKDVLIRSSDKSSIFRAPNQVMLMMAMYDRPPETFDHPYQNVAVLLEGPFNSYFKQKILPDEIVNSKEIGYVKTGKPTKIIVVADGDVALNPVRQGQAGPLGVDRYNRLNQSFYANKTFLLNCANYLMDDKGLLSVRSREVTLRMLDRGKIKAQRTWWQMINVGAPILSILLFGFFRMWSRKRSYGSQTGNYSDTSIMDYVLPVFAGLITFMVLQGILTAIIIAVSAFLMIRFTQSRSKAMQYAVLAAGLVNIGVAWWMHIVLPKTVLTKSGMIYLMVLMAVACIALVVRVMMQKRNKPTT